MLTSEGSEQREGAGEAEAEVMSVSDGAEEARVAAARLICVPRDSEG